MTVEVGYMGYGEATMGTGNLVTINDPGRGLVSQRVAQVECIVLKVRWAARAIPG